MKTLWPTCTAVANTILERCKARVYMIELRSGPVPTPTKKVRAAMAATEISDD